MKLSIIIYELWLFGLKQAHACIFGGALLFIMILSKYWYPIESIHRYDFIFLFAVIFQLFLLIFKFETFREAIVIIVFHIVATIMELFKTSDSIASWVYPEEYIFGIATVPLFTGFMYSAVGSYIVRCWRIFDFKFTIYPKNYYTVALVTLIYINFFSHHYIIDFRYLLLVFSAVLFWKKNLYFKIDNEYRHMPLLVGWILVALFIWFAENIATYVNIWVYPNQTREWAMVSIAKLTSWTMLIQLSFVLVAIMNTINVYSVTKSRQYDVVIAP